MTSLVWVGLVRGAPDPEDQHIQLWYDADAIDGSTDGQAMLVGCGDYLEIWRAQDWSEELAAVEAEQHDEDD